MTPRNRLRRVLLCPACRERASELATGKFLERIQDEFANGYWNLLYRKLFKVSFPVPGKLETRNLFRLIIRNGVNKGRDNTEGFEIQTDIHMWACVYFFFPRSTAGRRLRLSGPRRLI